MQIEDDNDNDNDNERSSQLLPTTVPSTTNPTEISMELNEKEEEQLTALTHAEEHLTAMLQARKEWMTLKEQYEERLLHVANQLASLMVCGNMGL